MAMTASISANRRQKFDEPCPALFAVERQANAGKIEPVETRQPFESGGLGALEVFAGRRPISPVQKTAFASCVAQFSD